MITFSVKNFDRFQHYKDRSPPWIKLYNELLDDYEFARLQDASKLHLILIWLLASRSDNALPYDAKWIAQRINANSKVDLEALRDAGFIVINQPLHSSGQTASEVLADCLQVARPEREGETETERETDIRASDSDFEEFRKAYPKRDGANPKAPARLKFFALVKSGVSSAAIIAGARAYATAESKNIGTPYIAQMVVFLNQRRWEDYAGAGPPREFVPEPGMPTREELEKKYAHRRTTTATETTSAPILESGPSVCSTKGNGLGMDNTKNGPIRRLGEILPSAGLGTIRNQRGEGEADHRHDDAN